MRQLAGAGGCEKIGIEHEQGHHFAGGESAPEGRVVGEAQVLAAEPDDRPGRQLGLTGSERGLARTAQVPSTRRPSIRISRM